MHYNMSCIKKKKQAKYEKNFCIYRNECYNKKRMKEAIMIQAIFFDIDGTLASFQTHQIPLSTFETLKTLKNNGIKLFIATGRGKDGLDILQGFPFDGYITLNGQYCFTDEEVIYENTIDSQDIQNLLNYLDKKPFPCGFTEEHTKYFNMRNHLVDEIHEITHNDNHPARDCRDVAQQKIYQCMCFVDEKEEIEVLKVMPHCHASRWYPTFCDISPLGGSKQHGIDQFLKYYHIDLAHTMAFGDGGNDIEMLKHVALSIAMKNANDKVKAIVDYVTDDVDHDGIYKACKHFQLL